MNAKTPELEHQLVGLKTNYENAQVAAAQAPDLAKATLNSQVEVIYSQIEEFFAQDSVIAALDELKDLRTAEYERIGELFANGEISDTELDERIEAIENSPKYRLLGLASELGGFALEDVTVETIDEDDETVEAPVDFVPFTPVEITTEKLDELKSDSDLDEDELELIGEVTSNVTVIEPETIVFTDVDDTEVQTEVHNAYEDDVIDNSTLADIELAFGTLESDPEPDELFYDEQPAIEDEPILPKIDVIDVVDVVEEIEEAEAKFETEIKEVTVEQAVIFAEEVTEITKANDELKAVAPKYLLRSSLKSAAETDLKFITPQMRREAVLTILDVLDSEDPLLEFITNGESSQEMFDFADYASSIVESPKWRAVKAELIDSVRIDEEPSALPPETATISPETTEKVVEPKAEVIDIVPKIAERAEEKAVSDAVVSAIEVLVETDNLFQGEISLEEFRSRTGIDSEVFIDVYRSGVLELEDEEKQVAIKEIKINAAEAILLQMHVLNPKLLLNADDTIKSRILSGVETELDRQNSLLAA